MKLVVNARFLTQRITGVQQYAWTWCRFLKEKVNDIVFVSPGNIIHPEMAGALDVTKIGYTDGAFWEQTELPLWLLRNGKPLLLNFGNTAPARYAHQVVTIHDMTTFVHPEWFSGRFSGYYKWLLPAIGTSSEKIITVSRFSAKEIIRYLDIPEDKVHVVYNTVKLAEKQINEKQNYVLAVGSFSQRKNYTLLLDIWDRNKEGFPELWIRGDVEQIFSDYPGTRERIASNPLIKVIEPVDEAAMQALYQHARLLVNPSLYEGFGLPNLEAMANGCPLLVSDNEVFREICGEHANYADPLNVEEWEEKIQQLIRKPVSVSAGKAGQDRAGLFSVETEGEKLLTLLESVMN